ncbi:RNA polymerase-binding protein RbpA [Catellatospora bangladeshensis]|uniref:RNA polymerase-binding protein RbpA n=1 Tax=Catellatospora bangladeshensis TaxID=310355 RepID=A0A8J3NIV2_9ACTN|nr:RNA polymerase-binding protein RbpA [Catellatospora bangladeshensis]GIF80801.1 RNA polymerase-binding protein RbpA [Catellatospora bangladeshensis]
MADRMLRGTRLGANSYTPVRETQFAPRQICEFSCAHGHFFEVTFAEDVAAPVTWDCSFDGTPARRVDAPEDSPQHGRARRTHWDMLLERRSLDELEILLDERLAVVRERRGRAEPGARRAHREG